MFLDRASSTSEEESVSVRMFKACAKKHLSDDDIRQFKLDLDNPSKKIETGEQSALDYERAVISLTQIERNAKNASLKAICAHKFIQLLIIYKKNYFQPQQNGMSNYYRFVRIAFEYADFLFEFSKKSELMNEEIANALLQLAKVTWSFTKLKGFQEEYAKENPKANFVDSVIRCYKHSIDLHRKNGNAIGEALALVEYATCKNELMREKPFNREEAKEYMRLYGEALMRVYKLLPEHWDPHTSASGVLVQPLNNLISQQKKFYEFRKAVEPDYAKRYTEWDNKFNKIYVTLETEKAGLTAFALLEDYAGIMSVQFAPAAMVRFFKGSPGRRYADQVASALAELKNDNAASYRQYSLSCIIDQVMKNIAADIEVHGDLAAIMEVFEVKDVFGSKCYAQSLMEFLAEKHAKETSKYELESRLG